MRAKPQGVALPLVLLLLMALAAFGHSALMLSRRELQATWAFRNLVRAREAAEIALRLALEVEVDPDPDRTPWTSRLLVSGDTEDGLSYRATRRWIDGEFFLLEGWGSVEGWVGDHEIGWIGWTLFPRARLRAFYGAIEVGSGVLLEAEAILSMDEFLSTPRGWSDAECEIHRSFLDSLFSTSPLPPVRDGIEMVPVGMEPGSSIPSLGLLDGPELLRRSVKVESSAQLHSRSGTGRGCPGSGNPVFQGTPGPLHLEDGHLCGILVTGGNLVVQGNAEFRGLALVGGDLILKEQAVFQGGARVRGRLQISGGGVFRGSGCASLRALAGVPSLQQPLLLQGGIGLETF